MRSELIFFGGLILVMSLASIECRHPTGPPSDLKDSTSHNFVWEVDQVGDGGGFGFQDVAIINDTCALAVGETYLKDSTGQWDPKSYSVAQWNGTRWTLNHLYYINGSDTSVIGSIRCIKILGPHEFWLAAGSVFLWDGTSDIASLVYSRLNLPSPNGSIEKLWGLSGSQLYGVGNDGTIVYFDGHSWQVIQSGTTLDIHDIWGATDPKTGETQILAVASNDIERKLLHISGTSVSFLPDSGLSTSLNSIWFVPNKVYFVVGGGIQQKNKLDNSVWSSYAPGVVTSYASGGVRGNDINDVFVAGSFMEIAHYNGSSWYNYRNEIPTSSGALMGIAFSGNLVIVVGSLGQSPVAVVGRR